MKEVVLGEVFGGLSQRFKYCSGWGGDVWKVMIGRSFAFHVQPHCVQVQVQVQGTREWPTQPFRPQFDLVRRLSRLPIVRHRHRHRHQHIATQRNEGARFSNHRRTHTTSSANRCHSSTPMKSPLRHLVFVECVVVPSKYRTVPYRIVRPPSLVSRV